MPIEVPDTRAFAEPPPRRRRKPAAQPVDPPQELDAQELDAQRVDVRSSDLHPAAPDHSPTAPEAVPVGGGAPVGVVGVVGVDGVVGAPAVASSPSAFSRPVRRRPVKAQPPVDVPAPTAPSAFSRPVRRRPKPAAEVATPQVEVAQVEVAQVEVAQVEESAAAGESGVVSGQVEAPSSSEVVTAVDEAVRAASVPSGAPAPAPAPASVPTAVPAPRPEPVADAPTRPSAPGEAAAAEVAAAPVVDDVPAITDTVVVRLAGTRYAVAMDAVAEVGRPPHVTRVPGVPAWIAGVANWRGRIMPVLDLRVLLGAPTVELGASGRIMVLTREGVTLAFLAERVEGVVSLELDRLEPVLLTLPRSTAAVLSGQLADPAGPIALLDLETLFGLRSQLPRVRRAG